MKISEKDYNLLVGLVEFHFKFAEYNFLLDSVIFLPSNISCSKSIYIIYL